MSTVPLLVIGAAYAWAAFHQFMKPDYPLACLLALYALSNIPMIVMASRG